MNMHILYLSFLQGITEFLPVSSSGHLILFSKFSYFPDQGIALDVAVHLGSALAVLVYFSETIWEIIKGVMKTHFIPNLKNEGAQLFWLLFVGTIPAVIVGFLLKEHGMEWARNTKLIGWTILCYGLLLWFADKFSMTIRQIKHMSVVDALVIGFAQCLALVPGTSRSGITITAARFMGIERRDAAKFSMLLSIPVILAAGFLTGIEVWQQGNISQLLNMFDGVIYSYIASVIAIYIVMWWLKKSTFLPFVIYRIILGSILLLDSYGIMSINI